MECRCSLNAFGRYEWKLRAVAMAQLLQTEDPEVMQMQSYNYDKQLQLSAGRILRCVSNSIRQKLPLKGT
jgi:hypothetical protein